MFVIGMVVAMVVPFVLTCGLSLKIIRPGYQWPDRPSSAPARRPLRTFLRIPPCKTGNVR
jgi:hypothetical protein